MSDFEFPNENLPDTTLVVLVDPTSSDGELALASIDDDVTSVSIVVLLTGRASAALREYANVEAINLADAGWTYLEQVRQRVERPGLLVETITASGPDPAYELAVVATERGADRVVVPPSVVRLDRHMPSRMARHTPLTLEVAGGVAVA